MGRMLLILVGLLLCANTVLASNLSGGVFIGMWHNLDEDASFSQIGIGVADEDVWVIVWDECDTVECYMGEFPGSVYGFDNGNEAIPGFVLTEFEHGGIHYLMLIRVHGRGEQINVEVFRRSDSDYNYRSVYLFERVRDEFPIGVRI